MCLLLVDLASSCNCSISSLVLGTGTFTDILDASGKEGKCYIRAPDRYCIWSGHLSSIVGAAIDEIAVRVVLDNVAGWIEPMDRS